MTPVLTTPRLVLRAPEARDAGAIARFLNDFAVSGNLARVPYPYHLEDAEAWLRTRRPAMPPEQTNFAILHEGDYAGQVGFSPGSKGPVIGYWLGQPFWGRGFMTEAVTACLDWFFATTRVDTVQSGVFHFNAASLAIQARLGFTEIGRSSVLCLARGAEVEHIDTQLTRARYSERRSLARPPGSATDATH